MLHKSKKTEVNENLTSEVTLSHPSVVMFGIITHHMSWVGTTAFHYHFLSCFEPASAEAC